jgi:exopolysaccharide biosynthesis polyprenyl glycosylphosphotransferase
MMANDTRVGRTVPGPSGPAAARPAVPSPSPSPASLVAPGRAAGSRRIASGRLAGVLALPVADSVSLAVGALSVPDVIAPVLYALAALAALSLSGLHRLRISLRVSDQIGRILAAVVLPALLVLPLLPAASAVRLSLTCAGLVIVGRLVTTAGLRAARRRGRLTETALIIGSGTFGAFLAQQLRQHPELGLRVAGFLDEGAPRRDLPEPVLGTPADLARVSAEQGIGRVLIAFGDWRDEDLVTIMRGCRALPADVCVVPRLYELGLAMPRGCLDEVWGVPVIPLRRVAGAPSAAVKRAADVLISAVLLVALAPVLGVLAAVIWLRSGCSPIFRQLRVTGQGKEAYVLKLMTIRPGADSGTRWAVDPAQCGRFSALLRATHLDELPQLVNVLRGEMSLVGPRPERGYFARQFGEEIPRYADRDRVRAGLTGWAQVHGLHGDTSIAQRSRFDNAYIEYWSPWLDLVILARTVGSALAGLGGGR